MLNPSSEHGCPEAGCAHRASQAWLDSLPVSLCIRSLPQLVPDLVDEIAAAWDDASSTSVLLEAWLVGDGAAGLPSEAASELLRLYEFNARCRVNIAPDTTWELPASRFHSTTRHSAFEPSQL